MSHICFTAYSYLLIDGIDPIINLVDFYNFKYLILWNYLSNFNETYTCYRGGCVELMYQIENRSGESD